MSRSSKRLGAFLSAAAGLSGVLIGLAPSAAPVPSAGAATTVHYSWPKYGHDASDTGVSTDPTITTANASTLGVRWMVPDQTQSESSPVAQYDASLGEMLVYQGTEEGSFTAFNAATGAIVWTENLGSAVTSTPIVSGGDVYVTRSFSPELFKLDASTGAVQCHSQPLESINYATATIATPPGGKPSVYIGENGIQPDGPVYAISQADCSTEWKFINFNTSAGSWDPYSYGVDAKGEGLLFLGSDNPDATVYAIDANTGAKVWSYQTQDTAEGDVGTGASITAPGVDGFADGALYISNNGGYTYALDLTTGALIWRFDYASYLGSKPLRGTAAVVDGHVIIPGPTGAVGLNAVTGKVIWNYKGVAPSDSAAAVAGTNGMRVVAFTDLAGNFDVLNATNGKLLYQHNTGGYAVTSVAEADGNFYVASGAGFLYDFGLGGSNTTPPTTTVTSPTAGSTVTNPNGSVTVKGTASGSSVQAVDVAIESGGLGGTWWDAATGQWVNGYFDNPAHLSSPGSSTTNWSLGLPVPTAGGTYVVQASAADADGQADLAAYQPPPSAARTNFVVSNLSGAPFLTTPGGPWVAPGSSISVSGSGFSGGETVHFVLAGATLSSTTASASGTFTAAVPIPAIEVFGVSALTATGQTSNKTATAPVDVSNQWQSSGDGPEGQAYEANDQTWNQQIVGNHDKFITQAWSYPAAAPIKTSPAVVDDVAYVIDDTGVVTALDVQNSEPLWTHSTGAAVDSSPAVGAGLVIYGTQSDSVVALAAGTGKVVWQSPTTSAVESAPVIAAGTVYVGSDNGTLYALNETTGALKWQVVLSGGIKGSPSVDAANGKLVVGDSSGTVTALSSTNGSTLWSKATGGPVTATPMIYTGAVYVGSQSGSVFAFNETTGAVNWTFKAAGPISASGAFWTDGAKPSYLAGDNKGDVYFLSVTNGSINRQINDVASPITGLSAAYGWAVISTASGAVYADKFPGEITWLFQATKQLSPATMVNGVLYVSGQDAAVRAFTVPGTQIP